VVRRWHSFNLHRLELSMNKQIIRGLVAASALTVAGVANAALPEAVGTAITAAQTDGVAAVGLLAAMGAAVFLIKKVLSKLGIL
jgi:hypothetical protein